MLTLKKYSQNLRSTMIDAERKLWSKLRLKQLNGYQFLQTKGNWQLHRRFSVHFR